MANFNLEDYETVEDRLIKFWEKYPDGRVETHIMDKDATSFIVMAHIYRDSESDTLPFSSGLAHEIVGQGMVNKTSALENCETSAIGRALANGGFATRGKRASREEMEKVQRGNSAKPKPELHAADAFVKIGLASDAEQLKALWNEYKSILDESQDGLSVRDYIMRRKEEMS